MISRAGFAGASLAAVASIIGLIPSSPASAATPNCTQRNLWGSTDSGVGFVWAPMSTSGSVSCSMKIGANNDAVYALQDSIVHCYHISITVDGDFGTNTKNALITVQSRIGTSADGEYGPLTAAKIIMRPQDTVKACGHL